MGLHVEQAWWLAIIALSAPLGWIALRWLHAMSRARAISAIVARSILLALLAMALAGASTVHRTSRLAVIAVVDVSDSVRSFVDFGSDASGRPIAATAALKDWLEQAAANRGAEDLLGVVAFDGSSLAIAAPHGASSRTGASDLDDLSLDIRVSEGTNIADALQLARALFPPDAAKRLLLISDGVETAGDALAWLDTRRAGAVDLNIPVDVLPLTYNQRREVMIDFVDAPPRAPAESTITVRIGLRSQRAATGTLRLRYEGEPIDLSPGEPTLGRRIKVPKGVSVQFAEVKLKDKIIHRFEAYFEPDAGQDTIVSNNRGDAVTVTPGRGAVLFVDGVSDGDPGGAGATLADTLRRGGVDVHVIPPAAMPGDLLSLHDFDLIILQNVGADEIPEATQQLLAAYVSELGGGLVMVGGPDSFGAGAWRHSAIADILPVDLALPERIVAPRAAVMIVLDSSGSMGRRVLGGARTQQRIANEAAALAIKKVDARDLIGVIAFSDRRRVIVPLKPNTDPDISADKVRGIGSDGGTDLYPALSQAGRMLQSADAKVKHIVVLSDGQSMGSPQTGYRVAAELAAAGITVSTIAVGDEADTNTLSRIAEQGRGKYYRVLDPNVLPRIFIKEIRVVLQPYVSEETVNPIVLPTGSPLTAGVATPWPELHGIDLTRKRPEPTITYAAMATAEAPLLAHWNVGLGQVAAFTSDAHDWAREWLRWPGYRTLWLQIARTISRTAATTGYELAADVKGDRLHLRLEVTSEEGKPVELLTVPGQLFGPRGAEPADIRLTQTGPGVYEGDADAKASGAYVVALSPQLGLKHLPAVVGGATKPRGVEHRRLRSNITLLRRLADATGGRVLSLKRPDEVALFDRRGVEPSVASSPIWQSLLAWSLLLLLLDVGTRRVAWDRLISRSWTHEMRRHAAEVVRAHGEQAVATVSALRGATSSRRSKRSDAEADQADSATSTRNAQGATPVRGIKPPIAMDDHQRRQAIKQALLATRGEQAKAPPAETKAPDEAGKTLDATTSGLLEAKKRARSRYTDHPEEPSDSP